MQEEQLPCERTPRVDPHRLYHRLEQVVKMGSFDFPAEIKRWPSGRAWREGQLSGGSVETSRKSEESSEAGSSTVDPR